MATGNALFEGIDTVVLYEEIAYEDVLPVQWRALPGAVDQALAASFSERNIRLLHACAAVEQRGPAPSEEPGTELQRLEYKVSLLLDLVGQLLAAGQPRPDPVPIRFSARGAVWRGTPPPQAATQGIVEIHLRDFPFEPLRLVGHITAVTPEGDVRVRFNPMDAAAADLIDKFIFRQHRRQIADSWPRVKR